MKALAKERGITNTVQKALLARVVQTEEVSVVDAVRACRKRRSLGKTTRKDVVCAAKELEKWGVVLLRDGKVHYIGPDWWRYCKRCKGRS